MSYVKIWIHLVFSTKARNAFLSRSIRQLVYDHIIDNCKKQHIYLQTLNGYTDHIHCLISLDKDQSIAQVARLIKGESSFWINKTQLLSEPFSWQDDYYAISLSVSRIGQVENYIKSQERHHMKKTFAEEMEAFETSYGLDILKE